MSLSLPIGIMGQVWYLIVSIPDLCTLTYFFENVGSEKISMLLAFLFNHNV